MQRVSARDQNLQRQVEAFTELGIPSDHIFAEKKSGKDFCREEYERLLSHLHQGDLLVVKSLDRLGRNYEHILEEWRRITQTIGADIRVLDMPLLDTHSRKDTLVGRFIADLVLQVLSFVAENERVNIRARQAEGIRIAKAKGVKFGRPPQAPTAQFEKVAERYLKKDIALREALSLLHMGKSTFYRYLARLRQQ